MLNIFNKTKAQAGLVGIYATPQDLSLAHVVMNQGRPGLLHCEKVTASGAEDRGKALEKLVKKLKLEGTRTSYVLSPQDYKLLLVEAPKVEPEEMAGAVKWKIKDLVGHPIEEMAITVFEMPEGANRGQTEMVYAVAMRKARIKDIIDLVNSAGLELDVIDIPELVMMNLTRTCADDTSGLAFIDLRDDGSTMNLSRDGEIYLTRRLNTRVDDDIIKTQEWESVRERLVLEIQRSLDYYASQTNQAVIRNILIAPRPRDSEELAQELTMVMDVDVACMDITDCVDSQVELPPDLQQSCLMAIGGAMRREAA